MYFYPTKVEKGTYLRNKKLFTDEGAHPPFAHWLLRPAPCLNYFRQRQPNRCWRWVPSAPILLRRASSLKVLDLYLPVTDLMDMFNQYRRSTCTGGESPDPLFPKTYAPCKDL